MNRHRDPDFEPRVADWLEDGPVHAPRDVIVTVRAALPSIRQRRGLAPWRNPLVNRLVMLGAAAALVVAVGGGAYLLGSNATDVSAGPAGVDAMAAYRETRDAICVAADAEVAPLRAAWGPLWAPNAPKADVEAGVAALKENVRIGEQLLRDLREIQAPAEVAEAHITANARLDDLLILIRQVIAKLEAQEFDAAMAIDLSTNPIARQVELFELENGLVNCP